MEFKEWSQAKEVCHAGLAPQSIHQQIKETSSTKAIVIHYPDASFIVKDINNQNQYEVSIGSVEEMFNHLHDAERFLWENWAYNSAQEGSL